MAQSAWTGYRASNLGGLVASSGQVLQHLTALLIVYVGARAIIAIPDGRLFFSAHDAGAIGEVIPRR